MMQIGHGQQGVFIGEYGFYKAEPPSERNSGGQIADGNSADKNRIIGWVEPACSSAGWILWVTQQGDALLYTNRDPGGAVIGEPIRIKATGSNQGSDDDPLRALRYAVHNYFNEPTKEAENKVRSILYGESVSRVVFYGPHACDKCAVLICRAGNGAPEETYCYPDPENGPIYPNTPWVPHVCQQRDIERVNGLRSLGWRSPHDPPSSCEPPEPPPDAAQNSPR